MSLCLSVFVCVCASLQVSLQWRVCICAHVVCVDVCVCIHLCVHVCAGRDVHVCGRQLGCVCVHLCVCVHVCAAGGVCVCVCAYECVR